MIEDKINSAAYMLVPFIVVLGNQIFAFMSSPVKTCFMKGVENYDLFPDVLDPENLHAVYVESDPFQYRSKNQKNKQEHVEQTPKFDWVGAPLSQTWIKRNE